MKSFMKTRCNEISPGRCQDRELLSKNLLRSAHQVLWLATSWWIHGPCKEAPSGSFNQTIKSDSEKKAIRKEMKQDCQTSTETNKVHHHECRFRAEENFSSPQNCTQCSLMGGDNDDHESRWFGIYKHECQQSDGCGSQQWWARHVRDLCWWRQTTDSLAVWN